MGSLDLPVQLWRTWLDVDVFHALVGDMPVEECLKLVAAVGSDGANVEGELLHDVVDEVDGVGLRVALVDLQRTNPIREPVEAIALADAVHGRVGRLDVVVAL